MPVTWPINGAATARSWYSWVYKWISFRRILGRERDLPQGDHSSSKISLQWRIGRRRGCHGPSNEFDPFVRSKRHRDCFRDSANCRTGSNVGLIVAFCKTFVVVTFKTSRQTISTRGRIAGGRIFTRKKLMWHRPVGSNAVACSSRADALISFFCCVHCSSDLQCF